MQHSCIVSISLFLQVFYLSKWYNHTVVLTQLQLGRNPVLFYQWPDFLVVIDLTIAIYALPMCMLILLSVDEILLLR